MKSQFKLMTLALVVFASNVQAVKYDWRGAKANVKKLVNYSASKVKASFTKANGKKAAMVIVPVAAVTALYKLNKAGKLESVKAKAKKAASNVTSFVGAKAKQAGNNVASWINNHKKTTAGLVTGAVAAYNRQAIYNLVARKIVTGKFLKA